MNKETLKITGSFKGCFIFALPELVFNNLKNTFKMMVPL